MPAKLERCVKDVEKKGMAKSSAWPICVKSTGLKPHKTGKKSKKKTVRK